MRSKKAVFLVILIILGTVFDLSALDILDPGDAFYIDAYRWEALGYIGYLPDIRPYAPEKIKEILNSVKEKGSEKEASLAEEYLSRMAEPAEIYLKGDVQTAISEEGTSLSLNGTAGISGKADIKDELALAYNLGFNASRGNASDVLPMYASSPFDIADDPAVVAGFEVNLNMNSVVSYGSSSFYLQAGISRSSTGDYPYSSIVFDNTTSHTPHIGFGIFTEKFSYEQTLYGLSASDNYGENNFAEKYLVLHTVKIPLTPKFVLSYYETMVYGNRLDIAYLLPAPFMVSQAFSSFQDNVQMGIGLQYLSGNGFSLVGNLYVDDLSANDLVKFNFDTKLIFAAQIAGAYVPEDSVFKLMYAEGLIIAPRMYAHSDVSLKTDGTCSYSEGRNANFQNYTHNGECIGTKIWPNSLSFKTGTEIELNPSLKIQLNAGYICHANVNESIETEQAKKYLDAGKIIDASDLDNIKTNPEQNCRTDGSVFNFPGFKRETPWNPEYDNTNDYPDSYKNHFPFMEQQSKMHVFQISGLMSYSFEISDSVKCLISLSDTFEYVKNYGVQNEIFSPQNKTAPTATDEDVAEALYLWRNNLTDVFKNYTSLSVKVMF